MLILNDTHIGVKRQGGTTPITQSKLRDAIIDKFKSLIFDSEDEHIVINGDLFDGFTVDSSEVIKVYSILTKAMSYGKHIHLIAGNHDWNPRGNSLSSFHLLCFFMESSHKFTFTMHDDGFSNVHGNVFCIPHMKNQDAFNAELDKALKYVGEYARFLLLHCNNDNKFAENSDHSLNLSYEKRVELIEAGWTIILGHEHANYQGDRFYITGCQYPTSVSDCIKGQIKYAMRIVDNEVTFFETFSGSEFAQIDWRNAHTIDNGYKFLRIVGDCLASEASEMINAVSKLRRDHDAYVIGNGVKVEGMSQMDDLTNLSVESIEKFDVKAALFDELTEREIEIVKGLL
jgi:metallophosphoesterase superfamily enzyme